MRTLLTTPNTLLPVFVPAEPKLVVALRPGSGNPVVPPRCRAEIFRGQVYQVASPD